MKKAKILHNPNAGKEEFEEEELCAIMKANGYEYEYSSVKDKGWKNIPSGTDFWVVAGGDGTVRKLAMELLEEKRGKRLPIVLLPAGTANNIAKSLGISGHPAAIVGALGKSRHKKFDVGKIKGLKDLNLFIESIGTGIFPELMKRMKENQGAKDSTPEDELKTAQELLHTIIINQPATKLSINIDGQDHSGNYLMIEIMNTGSLGPNLVLSAEADPGDGYFDVVLVPEEKREDMAAHVSLKAAGIEKSFHPLIIRGKEIRLSGRNIRLHVDDEMTGILKTAMIDLKPCPGAIEFIVAN